MSDAFVACRMLRGFGIDPETLYDIFVATRVDSSWTGAWPTDPETTGLRVSNTGGDMRISVQHLLRASTIAATVFVFSTGAIAHRPLQGGIPYREAPPAYRDADPVVSGTWFPL